MKQDKEIPKGYKDSPLGIIPEEWEIKRLGEICTFLNGRAYKQDELLSNGKYPVLRVGNFFTNNNWYYSNLDLEEDKYAINGDLLYAWSASFGPRFWHGEKVIYHYHIWKITNYTKVKSKYLFYLLDYDASLLQNMQQGGTMAHITKGDMEKRLVVLPPIPEQQKIAEILTTWDKAIEKQTTLIEKLELRKRGLMQQLLTGKKRLNGFSEEWKRVKLGAVYSPISTFSFSREQMTYVPQRLRYIHYGDIHIQESRNYVDLSVDHLPFCLDGLISDSKLDEADFPYLIKGDILLTDASEDYKGVGKSWEIINTNNENIIGGLHTICLRPNKLYVALGYGRYLFRNETFLNVLRAISQGTKVFSLSYSNISKLDITLPSLIEQIEIANTLTAADKEINLARTKLITLRTQKSGLMQQLLTGKKRINCI